MGSDEDWDMATNGLREALEEMNLEYIVNEGDGFGRETRLYRQDRFTPIILWCRYCHPERYKEAMQLKSWH